MLEKKGKKGEEIYMGWFCEALSKYQYVWGRDSVRVMELEKQEGDKKKRLVRHKEIVQIS